MRNLFNISALLCAAALITACSNEEMMESGTSADGLTLTATTGANTRTSVDGNYHVNWTTSDAFYAFGGTTSVDKVYSSKGTFTLKSGTGTTGTFAGMVTGAVSNLQYAVYPADKYASGTMTLTFPATYTYPNSNAPMFGKLNSGKTSVDFVQLLSGMMRIKLTGLETGVSGSLALAATGIAGSAELTIDDSGNASLGTLSSTANEVTVSFTTVNTDPLVLDIPVPAATYADGITATLQIGTGSIQAFKTTSGFVVTAGTIKEMPDINDIKIDASTGGITFSKVVENAEDAVQAMKDGAKSITVNTVKANDNIEIPASSTSSAPVTINISSVSTTSFTVKGVSGGAEAVKINVPTGSKGTLTVEDIDHVEISGDWEKVTASTGENTFVVKAGAVIKELVVTKGNIEIATDAVVNKLTLEADVTINSRLYIPVGAKMEVILGTHEFTLGGDYYTRIYGGGELVLTGDETYKGKVTDKTSGISLYGDGAKFTMKNVDYKAAKTGGRGVFIDKRYSSALIDIENSTMLGKYFCVNTNATTEVGSNNAITLSNSTFTADETALLVNIPVTVTATQCTFTGGWQGVFLRGGTSTFDGCTFNLAVNSQYDKNTMEAGAITWSEGNQAPSAAITAGNRSKSAYDYKTTFELKNSCVFSVKVDDTDSQDYPAIYIDAEKNKPNQGVVFKYSSDTFGSVGTGLDIRETTGKVTVNGTEYKGKVD